MSLKHAQRIAGAVRQALNTRTRSLLSFFKPGTSPSVVDVELRVAGRIPLFSLGVGGPLGQSPS